MSDEITGLNTCFAGRGAIDGRDHFDETLFLGDLNAKAAKFTAGLHAHIGGIIGRQVAGMGIKRGEHAVDCGFDQLFLINFFNILRADPFKDVAKQVQLFIDIGLRVVFLRQQRARDLGGGNHPGQSAAQCGHQKSFHRLLILPRCEPRDRIHRGVVFSHLYIERF